MFHGTMITYFLAIIYPSISHALRTSQSIQFSTQIPNVRIGIIDSGVIEGYLGAAEIVDFSDDYDYIDYIDHGNPIMNIVNGCQCNGYCVNAKMYIIKAFNKKGSITFSSHRYAMDHQKLRLCH
jgi:hypothetical protein